MIPQNDVKRRCVNLFHGNESFKPNDWLWEIRILFSRHDLGWRSWSTTDFKIHRRRCHRKQLFKWRQKKFKMINNVAMLVSSVESDKPTITDSTNLIRTQIAHSPTENLDGDSTERRTDRRWNRVQRSGRRRGRRKRGRSKWRWRRRRRSKWPQRRRWRKRHFLVVRQNKLKGR